MTDPLMLSVSGARGIVGTTMTPAVASDFAAAFASHLRATRDAERPLVVLGRDSRTSGELLAAAAGAGLAAAGCRVTELGVVATPTVGVMVQALGADGGLVITASHNPAPWNGLKCLDAHGAAPDASAAGRIVARFRERDLDLAPWDRVGSLDADRSAHERHVARVLAQVDRAAIRAATPHVVLDSVNGAGCVAGRMLLEELGGRVLQLNGEPTGRFAHEPEPVEGNLGELARVVPDVGAHVGFAQDPDADRLAIVDERGRYVGEEYTLALCAWRVLSRIDRRADAVVAANLSTSRLVDAVAERLGGRVVRTAVGEANVVEAMRRERAIVGGEGNGGVILPSVCFVRDSLSAMALVLELMAVEGRSLSALVDELPPLSMIKRKLDLAAMGGRSAAEAALERTRERFAGERLSTIDGVRIDFAEGWVHLRASNTEPIIRLIAEGEGPEAAAQLADRVAEAAGLG